MVVLGPSRCAGPDLWDAVVAYLARRWRVLRFDLSAPHTVSGVAGELRAVLGERGVRSFVYCGVSVSAAIGLHLAAHWPHLLESLVLVSDAAAIGDPAQWAEQAQWVQGFLSGHTMHLPASGIGVQTIVLAAAEDPSRRPAVAGQFAPSVPAELVDFITPAWHPARLHRPEALASLIGSVLLANGD